MKSRVFCMTVLCVAAALVSATALAETINLDFASTAGVSGVYSGTAASPDTGTTWNGITPGADVTPVTTTYTSGALVDSNGGATGATVTIQPNFWCYDGAADSVIAPALMHDYAFTLASNPGSTLTFSIDGLTGSAYDVYLYSSTGAQQSDFDIDGDVRSVVNTAAAAAWVEGDNYVLYSGVIPIGGSISVTVMGVGTQYYGVLNGAQVTAVPEPSTIALLVAGLFGLVAFAWRRK